MAWYPSAYGYPIRKPTPSELKFFLANRQTAGYAAEDGAIVLNPYATHLSDQEKYFVAMNEGIRLHLREKQPAMTWTVTPEQRQKFVGTPYEAPEREADLKHTLAARWLSGDPSAGDPTPEQQEFLDTLRQELQAR